MAQYGLRIAFELTQLGADLRAQRHRREHPKATEEEVRQVVSAWLADRSKAPRGDADGRVVSWPRSR